eukprot:COSAG05_NODE_2287_length_3273_cov_132.259609_5_plen_27_part_01
MALCGCSWRAGQPPVIQAGSLRLVPGL